jgi:hypothetical protein
MRNGDTVLKNPHNLLVLTNTVVIAGAGILFAVQWPGIVAALSAATVGGVLLVVISGLKWRREAVRVTREGTVVLEWRSVFLSDSVELPATSCEVYLCHEHRHGRWGPSPLAGWVVMVGRLPDVIAVARVMREKAAREEWRRVGDALGLEGHVELGPATPIRARGIWSADTLARHPDIHPAARRAMEEAISRKGYWP